MDKKVILSEFNGNKSRIFILDEPLLYDAMAKSVLDFKENLDILENSDSQSNVFYSDILKTSIQRFANNNSNLQKHRLFISSLDFSDEIAFENGNICYNTKSNLSSQDICEKMKNMNFIKYFSSNLYEAVNNINQNNNEISLNKTFKQRIR